MCVIMTWRDTLYAENEVVEEPVVERQGKAGARSSSATRVTSIRKDEGEKDADLDHERERERSVCSGAEGRDRRCVHGDKEVRETEPKKMRKTRGCDGQKHHSRARMQNRTEEAGRKRGTGR